MDNPEKKLLKAVSDGDLAGVKEALANGAPINTKSPHGENVLIDAVFRGRQEIVEFLIANGIDKEATRDRGDTALIIAVCHHPEMVPLLLSLGVNINAQSACGATAVSYAVDDLPTLNTLLAAGADINLQNEQGKTPLMLAIDDGHIGSIKALIAAKPDFSLKDKDGWTALDHADSSRNRLDIFAWVEADKDNAPALLQHKQDKLDRFFLESAEKEDMACVKKCLADGANINAKDKAGTGALSHAARHGNQQMAAFLISNGIDKEAGDQDGMTALMTAALYARTEMVQALLGWGANIETKDNFGSTAIFSAVRHLPTLNVFLEAGDSTNTPNDAGYTPLMLAVIHGTRTDEAAALLAAGADPNLMNKNGSTVMAHAVVKKSWPMIRLLLEAGAEVDIRNNRGVTPIDIAADTGQQDVATYLKEAAMERELSVFTKGLPHSIKATKPFKFK